MLTSPKTSHVTGILRDLNNLDNLAKNDLRQCYVLRMTKIYTKYEVNSNFELIFNEIYRTCVRMNMLHNEHISPWEMVSDMVPGKVQIKDYTKNYYTQRDKLCTQIDIIMDVYDSMNLQRRSMYKSRIGLVATFDSTK